MLAVALLSAISCDCDRHRPERAETGEPTTAPADNPAPPGPARRARSTPRIDKHGFLKGSTHAHSNRSADSGTSVHDVVRWYREHDYDFVVLTDHDRVTEYAGNQDLLVIPGVELTNNPDRCWPPPEPGYYCRVHVNALFVSDYERLDTLDTVDGARAQQPGRVRWNKRGAVWRVDIYQQALSETRALSGLAQINHPTWYRGVGGVLLAELARRGAGFVEIANQGFADWNDGDLDHPSAEAIWDHALTAGQVIWGVASDDAHHYYDAADRSPGAPVYPAGTGFVMVRAQRSQGAIRTAMERGDFYSSTGVYLTDVRADEGSLTVEVASPGPHDIAFIGVRDEVGGRVLARQRGRRATIALPSDGYVRAVITDDTGRKAWVQPVFAHTQNGRARRTNQTD